MFKHVSLFKIHVLFHTGLHAFPAAALVAYGFAAFALVVFGLAAAAFFVAVFGLVVTLAVDFTVFLVLVTLAVVAFGFLTAAVAFLAVVALAVTACLLSMMLPVSPFPVDCTSRPFSSALFSASPRYLLTTF